MWNWGLLKNMLDKLQSNNPHNDYLGWWVNKIKSHGAFLPYFHDSRKQNTSSSYLSFASKGKHFTHRIQSVHCRFYHSTSVVSYTCAIVSENQNKVGYYTGPLICTSWRSSQRKDHCFHKKDIKIMKVAQSQSQRQWQKDEGTLHFPGSYPQCSVIDRLVHSQTHPFN